MYTIDVDFEVWKALTARRATESVTYNDVIRDLLGLKSDVANRAIAAALTGAPFNSPRKFVSRDLALPDGTLLRATYRSKIYSAKIEGGRWIDSSGCDHPSPSAAATAITGNNVNGLRFWHAQRPSDRDWHRLDTIAKESER